MSLSGDRFNEPSEGQPFAFPFVVKIHDQRGQPVALLRGGGPELEHWVTVAPRSGRYEVEVTTAEPALTGSIRLLVTCSGDAPGCVEGQAGIPGVVTSPSECEPCPSPGELTEGGGCPDLRFALEQAPDDPVPDHGEVGGDPAQRAMWFTCMGAIPTAARST